MSKLYPLVGLLVLMFLDSFGERLIFGGSANHPRWSLATTVLFTGVLYWWYHLDKRERKFRAAPVQNAGMVGLAVVALPIYLIRSRGLKSRAVSVIWMLSFVVLLIASAWLGTVVGQWFAL